MNYEQKQQEEGAEVVTTIFAITICQKERNSNMIAFGSGGQQTVIKLFRLENPVILFITFPKLVGKPSQVYRQRQSKFQKSGN